MRSKKGSRQEVDASVTDLAEALRVDAELRALVAEREESLAPLRSEVARLGEAARKLRDRIEWLGEQGALEDLGASVPPVVAPLLDAAHLLLDLARPELTPDVVQAMTDVTRTALELRHEAEQARGGS